MEPFAQEGKATYRQVPIALPACWHPSARQLAAYGCCLLCLVQINKQRLPDLLLKQVFMNARYDYACSHGTGEKKQKLGLWRSNEDK